MKKKILTGIIAASLIGLTSNANAMDYEERRAKYQRSLEVCEILADKDGDQNISIEEQHQMFKDMGLYIKEVMDYESRMLKYEIKAPPGVKYGAWDYYATQLTSIEIHEEYMKDHGLKFKWDSDSYDYTLEEGIKKLPFKKKSDLRK